MTAIRILTTYNCPDIGKFGAGSTPAATLSSFPGPRETGEKENHENNVR